MRHTSTSSNKSPRLRPLRVAFVLALSSLGFSTVVLAQSRDYSYWANNSHCLQRYQNETRPHLTFDLEVKHTGSQQLVCPVKMLRKTKGGDQIEVRVRTNAQGNPCALRLATVTDVGVASTQTTTDGSGEATLSINVPAAGFGAVSGHDVTMLKANVVCTLDEGDKLYSYLVSIDGV
jgi:hypothetical protein